MAFFKAKVGDQVYEIEKLNLGDMQVLKHKFNLTDLSEFSTTDPDVIVGLMAIAIRKADPSKSIDQAASEAMDIDFEDLVAAEPDEDEAPAPLDDDAATVVPVRNGKSGKRPKTPGTHS